MFSLDETSVLVVVRWLSLILRITLHCTIFCLFWIADDPLASFLPACLKLWYCWWISTVISYSVFKLLLGWQEWASVGCPGKFFQLRCYLFLFPLFLFPSAGKPHSLCSFRSLRELWYKMNKNCLRINVLIDQLWRKINNCLAIF